MQSGRRWRQVRRGSILRLLPSRRQLRCTVVNMYAFQRKEKGTFIARQIPQDFFGF
jgi:hypothetical protein